MSLQLAGPTYHFCDLPRKCRPNETCGISLHGRFEPPVRQCDPSIAHVRVSSDSSDGFAFCAAADQLPQVWQGATYSISSNDYSASSCGCPHRQTHHGMIACGSLMMSSSSSMPVVFVCRYLRPSNAGGGLSVVATRCPVRLRRTPAPSWVAP